MSAKMSMIDLVHKRRKADTSLLISNIYQKLLQNGCMDCSFKTLDLFDLSNDFQHDRQNLLIQLTLLDKMFCLADQRKMTAVCSRLKTSANHLLDNDQILLQVIKFLDSEDQFIVFMASRTITSGMMLLDQTSSKFQFFLETLLVIFEQAKQAQSSLKPISKCIHIIEIFSLIITGLSKHICCDFWSTNGPKHHCKHATQSKGISEETFMLVKSIEKLETIISVMLNSWDVILNGSTSRTPDPCLCGAFQGDTCGLQTRNSFKTNLQDDLCFIYLLKLIDRTFQSLDQLFTQRKGILPEGSVDQWRSYKNLNRDMLVKFIYKVAFLVDYLHTGKLSMFGLKKLLEVISQALDMYKHTVCLNAVCDVAQKVCKIIMCCCMLKDIPQVNQKQEFTGCILDENKQIKHCDMSFVRKVSVLILKSLFLIKKPFSKIPSRENTKKNAKDIFTEIVEPLTKWVIYFIKVSISCYFGGSLPQQNLESLLKRIAHDDFTVVELDVLDFNVELYNVISEQDDDLISTMLYLSHLWRTLENLRVVEQFPLQSTEFCHTMLNPHMLFVLFLRQTGFDHSTILDLLISSETVFLEYFTNYLHLVHEDWGTFIKSLNALDNYTAKNSSSNEEDDENSEESDSNHLMDSITQQELSFQLVADYESDESDDFFQEKRIMVLEQSGRRECLDNEHHELSSLKISYDVKADKKLSKSDKYIEYSVNYDYDNDRHHGSAPSEEFLTQFQVDSSICKDDLILGRRNKMAMNGKEVEEETLGLKQSEMRGCENVLESNFDDGSVINKVPVLTCVNLMGDKAVKSSDRGSAEEERLVNDSLAVKEEEEKKEKINNGGPMGEADNEKVYDSFEVRYEDVEGCVKGGEEVMESLLHKETEFEGREVNISTKVEDKEMKMYSSSEKDGMSDHLHEKEEENAVCVKFDNKKINSIEKKEDISGCLHWEEEEEEEDNRAINRNVGEERATEKFNINKDCSKSFVTNESCLDLVMTVLVRLRLTIQRLVSRSLFPYKVGPVLELMNAIEDLYEIQQ